MGDSNDRLIFKNYEYFKAVIEEGGVSKAAEKLFISQSSVSKYLKRLEDNIGFKLFSRQSYPLCLTKEGELYLKYVNQIFELEKDFKSTIFALKESRLGVIKIGIPFFHSSIFFPAITLTLNERYPQIQIKAYEGSAKEIMTMLDQDKVDFAVIFHLAHNNPNMVFERLVNERILLIIDKSHPVLKKIDFDPELEINKISNADFLIFKDEHFVLTKKGHNSRHMVQNYFDKLNFKPHIILETSNKTTVINLVGSGVALAFIPEIVLKFKTQKPDLLAFEIDDPVLQRELGIAYNADNMLIKHHRPLIDISKKIILDYLSPDKID